MSAVAPAAPADADALAAIFSASRRTAMRWLPDLHTAEEDERFIRDRVMGECEVLVLRRGDQPVGFLALGEETVEPVYVRPDAQRAGVGTELLDTAKRARPAGLRLWVFQRNEAARAFYESHGFAELKRTDGAGNEEREPDVLLGWEGAGV